MIGGTISQKKKRCQKKFHHDGLAVRSNVSSFMERQRSGSKRKGRAGRLALAGLSGAEPDYFAAALSFFSAFGFVSFAFVPSSGVGTAATVPVHSRIAISAAS